MFKNVLMKCLDFCWILTTCAYKKIEFHIEGTTEKYENKNSSFFLLPGTAKGFTRKCSCPKQIPFNNSSTETAFTCSKSPMETPDGWVESVER